MANTVSLKKYGNRRLYDTEKSKYVTLDEIAETIRAGRSVEISDAQTKEDVTAFVLTQIMLEEAKKRNFLLPVPVLHLIICYGDNVLDDFMNKYLQKTIENYLKYKKAFDEQMKNWLDLGLNMSEMLSKSTKIQSPFAGMMDLFSSSKKPNKPRSEDPGDHPRSGKIK